MAGVTTTEKAPAYAVPSAGWGISARMHVTEFIGTFFLMFAVAVAVLSGSAFVPLAAGATLMVMVYAGGHLSGGHYHPAVTMAALVRRRIEVGDAIAYWSAQVAGAVAAGALARAVVNPTTVKTLHLSGHLEAAAAVVEVLTFALCYVVLNVATSRDQPNNGFSAWRSDSPSWLARSPWAASPVACSTRPSRSAAPPPGCSPGCRRTRLRALGYYAHHHA